MESKQAEKWFRRDFFAWFTVFVTIVSGGVWTINGIFQMKTAQAEQIKDTYYQGKKIDELIKSRADDKIEYMDKIKEVQIEQKVILTEIRRIGK